MPTIRQNKIARLIQKEIGTLFTRDAMEYAPGSLLTVTGVRMSPDLAVAKVHLSIFGPGNKDDIIGLLQKSSGKLRWELGTRVRRQLRVIPELIFMLDDSLDYLENIERLLKK